MPRTTICLSNMTAMDIMNSQVMLILEVISSARGKGMIGWLWDRRNYSDLWRWGNTIWTWEAINNFRYLKMSIMFRNAPDPWPWIQMLNVLSLMFDLQVFNNPIVKKDKNVVFCWGWNGSVYNNRRQSAPRSEQTVRGRGCSSDVGQNVT